VSTSQNPVLQAAEAAFHPELVTIDEGAIRQVAKSEIKLAARSQFEGTALSANPFAYVPYIVAMNTLNFQFWDRANDGTFLRYQNQGKVGALAMQDAMLHAWEVAAGKERYSFPESIHHISKSLLERLAAPSSICDIFGDIPAAAERKALLLEVLDAPKLVRITRRLVDRLSAGRLDWHDAQDLAELYPTAYTDTFLKKSQLTLMFISEEWNTHSANKCEAHVTACADYQLPKVLRTQGILRYDAGLAELIDNGTLISAEQEVAIRAATILACEKLSAWLDVSIPQVDFWLWLRRNEDPAAKFHLFFTTAY
jgi:hypothetical protein